MDLSFAEPLIPSKYVLYALLATASFLLWWVCIVLYRLFWSPLAKFPGPKLAAATLWYEAYYDIILEGQFEWHMEKLHQKYGPIIRINPHEIHIKDPYFFDQLYVGASTRKTDKYAWHQPQFGLDMSVATTISHELHRKRRAMIAGHFSVAAVYKMGPLIRAKVRKFMDRLHQAAKTGQPLHLTHAYIALTIDIITEYCFDNSFNNLDAEDFAPNLFQTIQRNSMTGHTIKQFPWILTLMRAIPEWLTERLFLDQATIVGVQKRFRLQVEAVKERKAQSSALSGEKAGSPKSDPDNNIFYAMVDADVPESEKSIQRLTQEAQVLIAAGFLTTAHSLETITYHLLTQPLLLARLREELSSHFPNTDMNSIPQSTLETLPYLSGVIYEGVRLSCGVIQRLPRVSPDVSLQYGDWEIPAGVPVSMSSHMTHGDPNIFPEPKEFRPERWLPMDTVGQPLLKFLTSFSRGTRQCVGMNLAWAELFLTVPVVFGVNLDMQLHDVDFDRDIKIVRDGFSPYPSAESKGLRTIMTYRE